MVLERGQEVVLDLGESREVTRVLHFNGIGGENATYAISQDGVAYEPLAEIEDTYCYTWYPKKVKGQGRYIKITAEDDNSNLLEVGFYSGTEKLAVSETPVTDEQAMVPYEKTYMNSMYFDEVYHARTAYEHVEGMWPYENTHPPLGKEIIALGIKTFGMNPFGWRFSGVLFAILMVPLMYLFGKKVFKRRDLAFLASFLITVDFMHLAHGRIATIDTYGVFFIILMYYFMYDFFMADLRRDRVRDHVWTLALGGLAFGLGIAAKWIGFYAAIGLVIMFFWSVGKLFNKNHWKKALCYIGLGTAFYAIIPFAIYYASYLPILNLENAGGFWSWQETMFNYHSRLTERHPFESAWYQWPFMGRPLWMFSGGVDENGITSTIVSFGNPAIWFLSVPAICGVAYLGKKLADKRAAFIIIGFLSQILPWVFISRSTFIYHFYACVPFVILAICFILGRMKKKVMVIYCVVALALFVLYWPILTGADVWVPYANALRCFDGWTLSAQR